MEAKTGTYEISGNTMTTTDDADGTSTVVDFCVNAREGRFQQTEGLATLTWIGTKQ